MVSNSKSDHTSKATPSNINVDAGKYPQMITTVKYLGLSVGREKLKHMQYAVWQVIKSQEQMA